MKNQEYTIEDAEKLLKQDVVTFKEFQKFAESTAKYGTKERALSCCFMGLVGEACEWDDAKTEDEQIKEAGDVLWKIANIARLLDFEVLDCHQSKKTFFSFNYGRFIEAGKKLVRCGDFTKGKYVDVITEECITLKDRVRYAEGNLGNLTHVYKANIIKLTERLKNNAIINEENR